MEVSGEWRKEILIVSDSRFAKTQVDDPMGFTVRMVAKSSVKLEQLVQLATKEICAETRIVQRTFDLRRKYELTS